MIIYEPKGKALEYSPLAANLYKGCSHACSYCYAPSATFTNREIFISDQYIKPRPNILEQIERDAKKLKNDTRPILLSFTSDLYQPANDKFKLSRHAIEILNKHNLTTTILTKGGLRACNDFDLLSKNKNNAFSVTLTTDNNEDSLYWEPGAALPYERIQSLKIAKENYNLKTWVSFEPVINPEAVIRLIQKTYKFVDLYKVGKINYHALSKTIDWEKFLIMVEKELKKYNKKYYIKKDLEFYRSKIAAK